MARKELLNSFSNTYCLYMMLLAFADELTTYADQQIEANKARALVTHQAYTPNRRFVNNRIAQQLFNNRRLRTYIEEQHLRWDVGMSAVEAIYKQLVQAPFYAANYSFFNYITFSQFQHKCSNQFAHSLTRFKSPYFIKRIVYI
jgi:hypothetical protein